MSMLYAKGTIVRVARHTAQNLRTMGIRSLSAGMRGGQQNFNFDGDDFDFDEDSNFSRSVPDSLDSRGGRGVGQRSFGRGNSSGTRKDQDEDLDDLFGPAVGAGYKKSKPASYTEFVKDFYKDKELDEVKNRSPEEVKQIRDESKMIVNGDNIPNPITSFQESTLEDRFLIQIKKNGIENPTPIQKQAIPMALSGRDTVGVSKTGSGKTLAFVVPAIVHILAQPKLDTGDGPIALVLAPTRELAQQIEEEVRKFTRGTGIRSTVVFGGANRSPQIRALQGQPEIIIATPGRLLDFLECNATNLNRTTYCVLDEADRMLDMGFQNDLERILGQCRQDRQTLMFSATWAKEVQSVANEYMRDPIRITIGSTELLANDKITQILKNVQGRDRDKIFLQDVREHVDNGSKVLVFVNQKKIADKIAYALTRAGVSADAIHGDRSQSQRDQTMKSFKQNRTQVLVATDVCARGIDIRDIRAVINYDMPSGIDSYVHRIGRTARGEDTGTSIGYMAPEDFPRIGKDLIKILERADQQCPPWLSSYVLQQTHLKMQSRNPRQQNQRQSSNRDYSRQNNSRDSRDRPQRDSQRRNSNWGDNF